MKQQKQQYKLTNGEHQLVFTIYSGAVAKIPSMILFQHLKYPSVGKDVPGMNEAIKHFSCLLNQVRLVGIVFNIII